MKLLSILTCTSSCSVKKGCTLSVGCSPALDTLDRNCPRNISDNGVLPNSVHRVTAPLFFGPITYIDIRIKNVCSIYYAYGIIKSNF